MSYEIGIYREDFTDEELHEVNNALRENADIAEPLRSETVYAVADEPYRELLENLELGEEVMLYETGERQVYQIFGDGDELVLLGDMSLITDSLPWSER